MLRLKKVSDVEKLMVYTDNGDLFGQVDEAVVIKNKIDSWKVRSVRDSFLSKTMPGAKGVIIPHQLVKSIGSIMIVAQAAAPSNIVDEAPTPTE